MCGICGVYQERGSDPAVARAAVTRMSATLRHRGPDDEGVWTDASGRVAFGNRRLAIIDLSPAGHQPMVDSRGEVVLTFNGAIYNFRELRQELTAQGCSFRGHSDTEVILALYLRDGAEMCRRLRGMFALAVWDNRTQQLLLARDRLGIKPLYYAHGHGCWVFASEIRAIRASGILATPVNPEALAAFLHLGSVPGPMTAFTGVQELPPATTLTVGGHERGPLLRRYWEVPAPEERAGATDMGQVCEEVRERLRDAVSHHLVSDVPLGVFLSGGVDSGAIVAMMREAGHEKVRTFSITFPEAEHDEGPDAARAAAHYGTEHTAYEVLGTDVAADLDRILASMDQPTIDGVNTYYVSRITRASGTVVALSGLGGDELFWGYPSFRLAPRVLAWQQAAGRMKLARPVLTAALATMPSSRSAKLRESLDRSPGIHSAYLAVRGLLTQEEVLDLLAPGPIRTAAQEFDAASAVGALASELPSDPASATGALELRGYMHNQLLRDTDVMSMAHSIEVRVPFLDHPLVEFASRLPASVKSAGRRPKGLLLRALGDRLLPAARASKRGFTFPIGQWLRGPLRPHVEHLLRNGTAVFRPEAVNRLWRQVQAGRAHWSRVWALVILSRWLGDPENSLSRR